MKTIAKILLCGSLLLAGLGYANAQSAASSSSNVNSYVESNDTISIQDTSMQEPAVDTMQVRIERGLPTPRYIENLFRSGRITEGLREAEKFKAENQKKTDPYNLLYFEMSIYLQAQLADPQNEQYAQKAEDLRQQLIAKFPNVSDTYLLQIDNNTPPQKVIQLATKAIELDPENISAYDRRGNALFNLGQTKAACADFEKLPWKDNLTNYTMYCKGSN